MSVMKKFAAVGVSALAVAGMLAVSSAPAAAGHRHWRGHDYGGYRHHYNHRGYRHRHYNDGAAAGLLGLGAGLIIGGAIANSAPPPPPPPAYYYGGPQPWSPDWMAYCTSRYRSFNPRTGYFLGYDGEYHFCR